MAGYVKFECDFRFVHRLLHTFRQLGFRVEIFAARQLGESIFLEHNRVTQNQIASDSFKIIATKLLHDQLDESAVFSFEFGENDSILGKVGLSSSYSIKVLMALGVRRIVTNETSLESPSNQFVGMFEVAELFQVSDLTSCFEIEKFTVFKTASSDDCFWCANLIDFGFRYEVSVGSFKKNNRTFSWLSLDAENCFFQRRLRRAKKHGREVINRIMHGRQATEIRLVTERMGLQSE